MRLPKTWFEYDWHIDTIDAEFGVDMALSKLAPDARHTVLYFLSFESPTEKRPKLTDLMEWRAESILKNVLSMGNFLLAGAIRTDEQIQFYVYGASNDAFGQIEKRFQREKLLLARFGTKNEPNWTTFFKLLYPDAAKLQTDWNRKQIDLLESQGDRLSVTRRLNLHMFFPTEPNLIGFKRAALSAGFAIGNTEFADETDLPYGVVLHIISNLNKKRVDEITTLAINTAESFGGKLVHWDCAVVTKPH